MSHVLSPSLLPVEYRSLYPSPSRRVQDHCMYIVCIYDVYACAFVILYIYHIINIYTVYIYISSVCVCVSKCVCVCVSVSVCAFLIHTNLDSRRWHHYTRTSWSKRTYATATLSLRKQCHLHHSTWFQGHNQTCDIVKKSLHWNGPCWINLFARNTALTNGMHPRDCCWSAHPKSEPAKSSFWLSLTLCSDAPCQLQILDAAYATFLKL
jgi:hypothetical protein